VDGILYLLSMRNNRITPPPRLLFEKLCGDDYSGRVLLVATMWERARNQELLETRKADLMDHWGTIIIEHDGTKKSAWSIVNSLLHTCREA
jgi:hypothetical protein